MLDKILKERNLPKFTSREEMLNVLLNEEYGHIPPEPDAVTYKEKENCVKNFCAGRAISKKVEATVKISGKEFTFPFFVGIPKKEGKHPFFISINFSDNVPDVYMPAEEIIDNGFAILSFCHKDITSDDGDFTNALAGILYENGDILYFPILPIPFQLSFNATKRAFALSQKYNLLLYFVGMPSLYR